MSDEKRTRKRKRDEDFIAGLFVGMTLQRLLPLIPPPLSGPYPVCPVKVARPRKRRRNPAAEGLQ
jgi:hypothetical protein